jgi:hypothetical protein
MVAWMRLCKVANHTNTPMGSLDDRPVPDGVDRLRQSLEPVTDQDAHVAGAAVLDLGEHRQPELGAFATVAGPQPEDVALAGTGDSDRDVDGSVGDLPITDLDEDRIDEHHRIHRLQRSVAPLGRLADTLSVIREMVSLDTVAP